MLPYTRLSIGVMLENGRDLIENQKVVGGSCTVRQILDISAFGSCFERSDTCPWLAHMGGLTQMLGARRSGCAISHQLLDPDVFAPFLICPHGYCVRSCTGIDGTAPAPIAACLPPYITRSGLEPRRICHHRESFLSMTY